MKQHNIFLKATPLPNVRGRVSYISSPERQEHLEAVHTTTNDPTFWRELAKHCQEQAKFSKTKNACEGREFMVKLANELYTMYSPEYLAKVFSEAFKKATGTENVVAIHWNKTKESYHLHIICAENREVNEVTYGEVLTRNTYYNAAGQRSAKKECVDPETKELLPGCEMIPKGERKKTVTRFGSKEDLGNKYFLERLKQSAVDLQNELLDEERFRVYKDDGISLTEQPIGNKVSEDVADKIRAKNRLVREYNDAAYSFLGQSLEDGNQPKDNLVAQKSLKKLRNDIKSYAMTSMWLVLISRYAKILRERIKENIEQLSNSAQTPKFSPLDEQIRKGGERVHKDEKSLKTRNKDEPDL